MYCSTSNSSNCFQCNTGYYLNGSNCSACNLSNCTVCNQTDNVTINCLQCNPGYYLVLNTQNTSSEFNECAACGPNCSTCSNKTYCLECLEQYYVVYQSSKSAVCNPCPPECLTCNNNNSCLFCLKGYYPNVTENINSNNPTNVNCTLCSINLTGCVSCFNAYFCKECTPNGYSIMPNPQGNCVPCGFGCIKCDNQQVCSYCLNGFELFTQTNTCQDTAGIPAWGFFVIITFGGAIICMYLNIKSL